MHHLARIVVIAGVLGAVAAPATLGAAPAVVIPVPVKPTACRELPPVLLDRGRAPRRAVRLDLRKVASRSGRSVETEQARTTTTFPDGTRHVVTQTRRIDARLTARALGVSGHLPFSGHLVMSYPGSAPTRPSVTAEIGGYFTAVNGGLVGPGSTGGKGGTVVNDHLPAQPLGIGARWRIVNCEPVYDTPARELRIYTLRSLAHGIAVIGYRDAITIDRAKVDLGTADVSGVSVAIRIVALAGSATGTERLPLANGFGERDRSVARVSMTLRATASGRPPVTLRATVVDNDAQVPAG